MLKENFKQKILLVILGIFLAFVVIEILLRIGGFIAFLYQESNNVFSRWYKRDYTILCFGESTTAYGYPKKLEEILNKNKAGIQFTVINKGRPGTDSFRILSGLEKELKFYKPDFVMTMMGINDSGETKIFVKDKEVYSENRRYPLRIIKLVESLKQHIAHRQKELSDKKETIKFFQRIKEKIENNHKEEACRLLLGYYSKVGEYRKVKKPPFKEINLDPESPFGRFILGKYYFRILRYKEAKEEFIKCLGFMDEFPGQMRENIIVGLAACFIILEEYEEAERITKAFLPKKIFLSSLLLAKIYLCQERIQEAEEVLKIVIKMEPRFAGPYVKLGYCYRKQGKFDELEVLLKDILDRFPPTHRKYNVLAVELAYCLTQQGKLQEAERVLKDILPRDPRSKNIATELIKSHEKLGNFQKKEYLFEIAREEDFINSATVYNYRKLRDEVFKRGKKLVCVQYPMREVLPLKRILGFDKEIIFVDNRKIFLDAVADAKYDNYFLDHFGGDFGHCTPKGNELLAENIAKSVLKSLDIIR